MNAIKQFVLRHIVPVSLIVFGLVMLLAMGHLFSNEQVGINPTEFILKGFAKVFYLGVAWLLTHIIIKYFFPTIYEYCRKLSEDTSDPAKVEGGVAPKTSEFTRAWRRFSVDKTYDPRITATVNTHIGIFIAICLLLALAF